MATSSVNTQDRRDLNNVTTPPHCIADFCLIPMGTAQSPSVSKEISWVKEILIRSGLTFEMHSAGTTVQGSWKDVTETIGKAHALLHERGVVRIATDIRIGTRTDKKQNFQDKVPAVERHLHGD